MFEGKQRAIQINFNPYLTLYTKLRSIFITDFNLSTKLGNY
jgi:hypothetical protein